MSSDRCARLTRGRTGGWQEAAFNASRLALALCTKQNIEALYSEEAAADDNS